MYNPTNKTSPNQTPESWKNLEGQVDLLGILTQSLCPLLELVDAFRALAKEHLESWLFGKMNSRLVASDTTTPVLSELFRLLEVVCLGGRDEVGKCLRVLGSDIGDGDSGGGLFTFDASVSHRTAATMERGTQE